MDDLERLPPIKLPENGLVIPVVVTIGDAPKFRELQPLETCSSCKFWAVDEAEPPLYDDSEFYHECKTNIPIMLSQIRVNGSDDKTLPYGILFVSTRKDFGCNRWEARE